MRLFIAIRLTENMKDALLRMQNTAMSLGMTGSDWLVCLVSLAALLAVEIYQETRGSARISPQKPHPRAAF